MEKLNFDKGTLRKFAITMFFAFCVIGTILLFRQRPAFFWFYLLAGFFIFTGLILPGLLKPVYIVWMRFAYILSYINVRLILTVVFYLVFTPIGLIMRLLKIDLLDRKIEKQKQTYWKKKEMLEFSRGNYERRF